MHHKGSTEEEEGGGGAGGSWRPAALDSDGGSWLRAARHPLAMADPRVM